MRLSASICQIDRQKCKRPKTIICLLDLSEA